MREQSVVPRLRPTPAVLAAAGLIGAVATFALSYRYTGGHKHLLDALVAVGTLALVFRWTRWAFYVWLVVVASILPTRVLPISAGTYRSDAGEAIAFAIVIMVVVRWAMGDRLRRPTFVWPLLLLVAAAVLGAGIASWHGAPRADWLAPLKTLLLYLLPLAVVALHRTNADVEALERWVLRICVVASGLALLSVAAGLGSTSHKQVVTLGLASDANRLRPAVLNLVVLGVLLVLARCVHRGITWQRMAALLLFATLVALSFTRSTWVPLLIAIALFVLGRPGARVPLRGLRAGVAIFAIGVAVFAGAASGSLGPSAKAVTARVESVGNSQVFQENSYQDRANEDTVAWAALQGHQIQGIGLGEPYGAVVLEPDPVTGQTLREPRRFIQNSYLYTWLGMGLLGVIAWAAFAIAVTVRAVRARRDPSPAGTRAFAAACALFALGLQATFQTDLYNRSVIATVACAIVFLLGAPRRSAETG